MSRDVLSDPGEGPLEQPPAEDAVGRLRAPLVRHLVPRVLPLVFRFGQGEKKKKKAGFQDESFLARTLLEAAAERGVAAALGFLRCGEGGVRPAAPPSGPFPAALYSPGRDLSEQLPGEPPPRPS